MRTDEFEELLESVREGGAILRGEVKPSRSFHHAPTPAEQWRLQKAFAICVKTDNPEILVLNKIYQVMPLADDMLRVSDESAETSVYPSDYFLLVSFPPEVEQILARVAKQ